jgi:hypothetical protein
MRPTTLTSYRFLALILLSLLGSSPYIHADDTPEMWPGTIYSATIPTYQEVLGYAVGERISTHRDMLRFFDALAAAAPTRIKIREYGRTWEGRRLIYAVLGSSENIANLDRFAADMQRLADPRITNIEAANTLTANLPASVWLAYGVHGNEISSTDAAMMTAYHMLAALDDPTNQKIGRDTLVFIDPLQNPDGRERFTSRYYATVGLLDSPDRLSAEHNEPWPSGRTNHYLFDMNRDWLAMTQPETQGRIRAINKYKPLVVIDLHEMGGDSSYYFAPAAQPFNPHMTDRQLANMALIGRNQGRHFDSFGFDYFTREVYDAFYPGYGDSWPTFYGAAASTYEVASARGARYRKASGEILTFANTVQQHFVASISTAEATAENRQRLLEDFYDYQVSAITRGRASKQQRYFVLPNIRDRAGNDRLASLMTNHGVEVWQAQEDFKACGKRYSAGARYIDTAQPRGRFATTTLISQVDMSPAFIAEQERRRARKLDDEIYDVTAWSLPLMFNLDVDDCGKLPQLNAQPFTEAQQQIGQVLNPDAAVAYLVPWGDMNAGRFLTAALRAGLTVKSADKAFQLADQTSYPAGTLIIEHRRNNEDVGTIISQLATQTGAQVTGVDSSWVTQGPSFGSRNTVTLTAPTIAMAWDSPTNTLSAGNTRFVIERQFNYPVTAIRTRTLKTAELSRYDVLILPAGKYDSTLGDKGRDNLLAWVKRGGVLITMGSATAYAAKNGLVALKREAAYREQPPVDDEKPADPKAMINGELIASRAAMIDHTTKKKSDPDHVPGVLANVSVDTEHWLSAGVNENLVSLITGGDIYAPIKLADGNNIGWFKAEQNLLASGYLWPENQRQLAFKPFLVQQNQGRGMVISFTQEPAYRAYMDGLNVLLMNTIFRATAHTKRLR